MEHFTKSRHCSSTTPHQQPDCCWNFDFHMRISNLLVSIASLVNFWCHPCAKVYIVSDNSSDILSRYGYRDPLCLLCSTKVYHRSSLLALVATLYFLV